LGWPGGLASMSGALLANIFNPTPDVGAFPAAKSYVIVVLGGMGSVPGAIVGSLLLGVLERFGGVYVSV
jgi:branched-chain amino acid transport system permease protein